MNPSAIGAHQALITPLPTDIPTLPSGQTQRGLTCASSIIAIQANELIYQAVNYQYQLQANAMPTFETPLISNNTSPGDPVVQYYDVFGFIYTIAAIGAGATTVWAGYYTVTSA